MPAGWFRSLCLVGVVGVGVALLGGCREVGARRNIQEANKLYYAGKYEEAITLYDEALAAQPDLAIGWYNLALTHHALFSPGAKTPQNDAHAQAVIDALQKYRTHFPKDPDAVKYLLSTYMDWGHYEGAIEYFKQKLADNPNDLTAVAQLADIYQKAAKFAEAIEWHKKHAELDPKPDNKADAWYSIGVLDWRRLHDISLNPPGGAERVKIADEGLAWLQKANEIRKNHLATLAYLNLLYRERALGQDTSYARAVDTATAQVYYKQAKELQKK
jgi:tetratricopeptide (TPR) repeat protein